MKIKPEDRIIISIPEYKGAGIYMIKNTITGKIYIGSSKNIHNRIKEHDQYMRKGWCNDKFQEDIDKGHKFTCEIIEKCDNMMFVEMREREKYYSEVYNSFEDGYNVAIIPTYNLDFFKEEGNQYMIDWLSRKV